MKNPIRHILKYSLLAIALCVAVLIVILVWLYSGNLNNLKKIILYKFSLPVALVNNKPLKMADYAARWQTYLKLYEQGISTQNSNQAQENIFAKMIKDEQIAQICEKYNITLDQKEIESEYSEQVSAYDGDFENFLNTYKLNPSIFKQYVIKPQILAIKLQTWFNSQEQLNQKQYELADNLINQIKNGQDMAYLATQFTQENAGKDTEGDIGFIDPITMLSEMREPIYALAVNETKIIANRFGINIIKLEEKQGNLVLLRQIFLQPENFDFWLEQETKNFKITKLINF